MSTPVSTPSADLDVTEPGGWAPNMGFATMDQAGLWCYIPDQTNQSANTSRILRVNVTTLAVEVWLDHAGGLPPQITGLCFSTDFTRLFATSFAGTHLLEVDFGSKAVSDLGDLGYNLDALYALNSPNQYVGFAAVTKNLFHLGIAGAAVTIAPDYLTANAWTPGLAVDVAGSIFRAYGKYGPGTDGPLFHYVGGKFPVTRFDAGYLHGSGTQVDGPAYSAKFAAESLEVMDGVLYFTQNFRLRYVYGGAVALCGDGTGTAVRILAASRTLGRLVTRSYSVVNVWS